MLKCQFCENNFKTKGVLKSHQKTTKYCLKLQNKDLETSFICSGCDSKFTQKINLNNHTRVCSLFESDLLKKYNLLEKEIIDLKTYKSRFCKLTDEYNEMRIEHKREIQILQDKLENIAIKATQRPTTTYNNRTQINNIIEKMDIITDNHLMDQSPNLTVEHIKQGVKGYVEYAINYPLKNRILCVDYARRKIKYRDANGEILTDPEMSTLSRKFFESIADKNKTLAMDVVSKLPADLDPESRMKIVCDMADIMSCVNQSATGNKNDFTHDFVRGVCSKTVY
jgi:hypothetical protein